ncbi:hypothetical protein [Streptomyces sp. BRA346]|uniref:hypothetical protein n=1 Tax=Streptomyces sp. BRA346 TaxID=2878199 RepID=UPI0040628A97
MWTAEVTGHGRERWPGYFPDDHPVRPYRHFRIQAAVASRMNDHQVVVHLVWAGASGSGFLDNRTARVLLTPAKGGSRWVPSR